MPGPDALRDDAELRQRGIIRPLDLAALIAQAESRSRALRDDALLRGLRHLPGKHDQSSHGRPGVGGVVKAAATKAAKTVKKAAASADAKGDWRQHHADRREWITKIARTAVVSSEPLGGGWSAATNLDEHTDGAQLVRKSFPDNDLIRSPDAQVDAEYLGALVAAAIGVNAPAVVRSDASTVLMEYVPDAKTGAQFPGGVPPSAIVDSDAGRLVGLLDIILANGDRNSGNWLVTKDGSLVAIDHGLGFTDKVSIGPFGGHFSNAAGNNWAETNDMSPGDMAEMRSRLESIQAEFDDLGRRAWWDEMMWKFARIEERAAGTRSRL